MKRCGETASAGAASLREGRDVGHVCLNSEGHKDEHACPCGFRWDANGHWHGPNRHEGPCTGGAPGDPYPL